MRSHPRFGLTIRGLNDPSPDDVAVLRKTYSPVFGVAKATGDAAADFHSDIGRVAGELLVFVPSTHRSFVRRLAKDAVIPNPDDPYARCLFMNWQDWTEWERLARFVRDVWALHHAASQGPQHVQRLHRMLRDEFPEMVRTLELDRKGKQLEMTTDRIDAMPQD